MTRFIGALLLVMFSGSASAIIPENGWWWNSSTSGSGFNLEVQDNLLFFAAFTYETNGTPSWLTAGGPMSSDRAFTAPLNKFSAGSCIGCPYNAPRLSAAGTVSLQFTSSQTAVLTVNGTSINVTRFNFWLNETAPDAMLGEWSMVVGESAVPAYFGERVQFRNRRSDSSGAYLAGNRLGSTGNVATVSYDSNRGVFTSLLDSSTDFYRYSEWRQTGFNRIEGTTWVFNKSSSPTGSGLFMQAYRSASASFVTTGFGPASSKSAPTGDARQTERDAQEAMAGAQGAKAGSDISPESLAAFQALKSRLVDERQVE